MSHPIAASPGGAAVPAVARGGVPNAYGQPTPHFVVHNKGDTVGVVVTEDVHQGDTIRGWLMETDETIELTAQADIPLGHKVAVRAIAAGDTIVKYEHDIGRAVEDIPQGGYVHAHNIKTKRW